MRKAFVIVVFVLIGRSLWANANVDSVNVYRGITAILRHATEVHFMYDNCAEFAVNVMFEIDNDSSMLRVANMVPLANTVSVLKFQYKILNPSGKVLLKQKVRKSHYDSIKDFLPINATSEYLARHEVIRVELDFRLRLTEITEPIQWPNINGVQSIQNISLRLLWDSPLLFSKTSNIDQEAISGLFEGYDYLLWQIDSLTPQGAKFEASYISNPSVKLVQNIDI